MNLGNNLLVPPQPPPLRPAPLGQNRLETAVPCSVNEEP
jgi:hypothetical protein